MKKYSPEELAEMRQFLKDSEKDIVAGYTHVNLDKNLGQRMFPLGGSSTCTGGETSLDDISSLNKQGTKKK